MMRPGSRAGGALLLLVGVLGCERPCDDACHRAGALALAPVDWSAALAHVAAVQDPYLRAAVVLEIAGMEGLAVRPSEGMDLCVLSQQPEVQRQCSARFSRPHMQRALDAPGK